MQKIGYDGKYPYLIPPNPQVRSLLVFQKDDPTSEALLRSCERLNIESTRAKNTETALELFQHPTTGGHHLVIVDGRCKNIDFEAFGRLVDVLFSPLIIIGFRFQFSVFHNIIFKSCFYQITKELERQSIYHYGVHCEEKVRNIHPVLKSNADKFLVKIEFNPFSISH